MKILVLIAALFAAAPAWGAFPAIATVGHSTETSDTTTHDAVVPSGISAGDMLMMNISLRNFSNVDPLISGAISGWSVVSGSGIDNGDTSISVYGIWYYKWASGGETDFTYTSTVSVQSVTRILRITGAHVSTVPECTTSTFDGDYANSNELIMSWGSADNLFISAFAKYNPNDTITVYPTSYTGNQYNGGAGSGNAIQIGMATRDLAAGSDDPAGYTFDGPGNGVEWTCAVRPASAPPPPATRQRSVMFLP